jgi:hypothetical protein
MQVLLSHWHCIAPIAAILVAMLFMLDKSEDKNDKTKRR